MVRADVITRSKAGPIERRSTQHHYNSGASYWLSVPSKGHATVICSKFSCQKKAASMRTSC